MMKDFGHIDCLIIEGVNRNYCMKLQHKLCETTSSLYIFIVNFQPFVVSQNVLKACQCFANIALLFNLKS
jgi:hypothetical protein